MGYAPETWTELVAITPTRLNNIEDGITKAMPTGGIIMWSGTLANIPAGWQLCDGTNGTPNLIGKFIRGVNTDSTDPGITGGSDAKTLITANLPAHSHTVTVNAEAAHTHVIGVRINTVVQSNAIGGINYWAISGTTGPPGSSDAGSSHIHTASSGNTGSGTAFDIRPAYYELAYIMRM